MKVKKLVIFALILGLLTGPAWATDPKPQITCPVLGGNIDKKVYVDYQGQRIYFCCPGCDVEFKKNPDKYLKKMKEQGVTPEKTPAK